MSLTKPTVFTGVATALITPFRDGKIDYPALSLLIERQISSGVSALLVAGTTGEASTLSFSEHRELVSFSRSVIAGRVPLIAGCGSNSTDLAAKLARSACSAGADALLAVTPYYNKASDSGLLRHFSAISSASSRPVIVYNVPSRTGVSLTLPLYLALSRLENIVAVKEASGDLSLLSRLVDSCSDSLAVYTGNDDLFLPSLKLGALGVISVSSNLFPSSLCEVYRLFSSGSVSASSSLFSSLLPRIRSLFLEVNPIPVKYAASLLHLCLPEYRLPLCPPSPSVCRTLEEIFGDAGAR